MSDEANVPQGAVIEAPTPHTPEVNSQIQPPEKVPEAAKPDAKPAKAEIERSSSEAVKRAMEAVKAREAEKAKTAEANPADKVDAKQDVKPADRTRADDGKFAAKESTDPKAVDQRAVQGQTEGNQTSEGRKPHQDAPARFNETGKRDWANTPDTVKEEVYRTYKNLEDGYAKHKESAERYEKVREFDDLARKNGREGVHESLKEVVEIENAFKRNPVEGLKKITDHFGIDLHAVASHIVGQNPNQQVAQAHSEIQQLKSEIARMKEEARAPEIVQDFFSKTPDADKDDVKQKMTFLIKNGTVQTLEDAWEYIRLFTPASSAPGNASSAQPAEALASPAPALNPAGSKSVSGAPSGGVSPASKQPVSQSTNEAVRRAMAKLSV